jgi:hypothetical protein
MVKWNGPAPHPFFRLSWPNTFAGASGCRCNRHAQHRHRTHRGPFSPARLQIQLKYNRPPGSKLKAGTCRLAGEANWAVRPGALLPKKRGFLASPVPMLEVPRSFSFGIKGGVSLIAKTSARPHYYFVITLKTPPHQGPSAESFPPKRLATVGESLCGAQRSSAGGVCLTPASRIGNLGFKLRWSATLCGVRAECLWGKFLTW